MTPLNETPRVEAAEFFIANAEKPPGPTARWRVVDANFARQLERENGALLAALQKCEQAMSVMLQAAVMAPRVIRLNPHFANGEELTDEALAVARATLKPHSP